MNIEFKVTEEVAVRDMADFVEYHTDKELDEESIKETYPQAVKAIKLGLLTFDDAHDAFYTLREPVKNPSGDEVILESVKFRTRLTTADEQRLFKGLDPKKDAVLIGHKTMSFIIGQPVAMLDRLSKFDKKAIEQVSTLFF